MSPTESLKRRGPRGRLEHKRRLDQVEVTMLGQVVRAEAWVKERIHPAAAHTGSWAVVSKRIWRRRGIEIVDLGVDGERWWSVALTLGPDVPDLRDVRPLVEMAITDGRSHSYPSWLLALRRAPAETPSAREDPGT